MVRKSSPQQKRKPIVDSEPTRVVVFRLLILYAFIVGIRFLLALLTTRFPLSNIDEFLYYGLARSIAERGELLFRGRDADYQYLVYPLLLSPIYRLFKEGSNYYRLVQLWNILLMSLSVFPLYGISHKLLKNKRKALILSAVLMLTGDFILGQVIYSENVIYPLFFTAVFITIAAFEKKRWSLVILLGAITILLYETKPGSFVFPAVSLLFLIITSIKEKDKVGACQGFAGVLTCVALGLAFFMMRRYVFHSNADIGLSIYSVQVNATNNEFHLGVFLRCLPQYLYYFILACGIICFFRPFINYRGFDTTAKSLFIITLVSLMAMIIGTAWTINRHEYATHAIHLRYIGMYVPVFGILSFAQSERSLSKGVEKTQRRIVICILSFVIVCAAIWGVGGSENSSAMIHELLSISYAHSSVISNSGQRAAGIIIILLSLFIGYAFFIKGKANTKKPLLVLLSLFLLVNNAVSYRTFNRAYAEMEQF